MTLLSQLLPPANVKLDINASSKKALFEQAVAIFRGDSAPQSSQPSHASSGAHAAPNPGIQGVNPAHILSSLLERERLGSTALGQGIAIPHGRVKGLREAVGAFLRADSPMEFDAPDGKPVSLIFILLVPERATDKHLQILSELAQMFSDREVRRQLTEAPDAGEAQRIIVEWDPNRAGTDPGH